MGKVSIIVPIYNSSSSLKKCIESIINQTFNDFELLLINDGSTDNSEEICRYYAKKDSRIKYIYKENSGPSDSRNIGLKNSTSEFIQFVDADDTINENMTLQLVNQMESNVDLTICGFNIEYIRAGQVSVTKCAPLIKGNFKKEDFYKVFGKMLVESFINAPWNKMYRRDLIVEHKIGFLSHINMGEDLLFNLDYMKACNNIFVIDDCLYNYKVISNSNSLSQKFDLYYFENQLNLKNKVRDFMKMNNINDVDNKVYFCDFFLSGIIFSIENIINNNIYSSSNKINEIKKIVSNVEVKKNLSNIKNSTSKKNLLKKLLNLECYYLIYFIFFIRRLRRIMVFF